MTTTIIIGRDRPKIELGSRWVWPGFTFGFASGSRRSVELLIRAVVLLWRFPWGRSLCEDVTSLHLTGSHARRKWFVVFGWCTFYCFSLVTLPSPWLGNINLTDWVLRGLSTLLISLPSNLWEVEQYFWCQGFKIFTYFKGNFSIRSSFTEILL